MNGSGEHPKVAVQREWLVRCWDGNAHRDVCSVEANDGEVAVATADGHYLISLDVDQLARFRVAFDAATAQAQRDNEARRAAEQPVPTT